MLDCVRVLGWQFIGLILVLLVGFGLWQVNCSLAAEAKAEAQITEDIGVLTGFLADCIPTEKADEVNELVTDWVEFGIDQAHDGVKEEKGRLKGRD